jgi:hypothetical protein
MICYVLCGTARPFLEKSVPWQKKWRCIRYLFVFTMSVVNKADVHLLCLVCFYELFHDVVSSRTICYRGWMIDK